MKTSTLKYLTVGILTSMLSIGSAQENIAKSSAYFEITASALQNDKKTNHYEILVYLDGVLKDSLYMKRKGTINIQLEGNKVYSIMFRKKNYPPRVVIVNTEIPNKFREIDDYPFDIQVELSPETSTCRKEMEDYPVAILLLDTKEKNLIASESYYKETHND